jgi:Lrp/AsnC family transcriptional regulator for asnA, asnC and gidA
MARNRKTISRPSALPVPRAVDSLDELDRGLIELLRIDGRQPNTELARKLKVAEGTIRNRIAKLLRDDLIQVSAWVDPIRVAGQIYAHIEVEVESGKVDEVAERIAQFEEVVFEGISTGRADIFVSCVFRSTQHMDHFLTRQLASIEGIRRTSSSILLRIVRRQHRYAAFARDDADGHARGGKGGLRTTRKD